MPTEQELYKEQVASTLSAYLDCSSLAFESRERKINFDDVRVYPNVPPKLASGIWIDWLKLVKQSINDVLIPIETVNTKYYNTYPNDDGCPIPASAFNQETKQVNITRLFNCWNWYTG